MNTMIIISHVSQTFVTCCILFRHNIIFFGLTGGTSLGVTLPAMTLSPTQDHQIEFPIPLINQVSGVPVKEKSWDLKPQISTIMQRERYSLNFFSGWKMGKDG